MSTKAIPLRRSRATTRVAGEPSTGLTERVGTGLRLTIVPARSIWLAGLGSTSFAIRGASAIWSSLIAEGAAVEDWLLGIFGRGPKASI